VVEFSGDLGKKRELEANFDGLYGSNMFYGHDDSHRLTAVIS